MRHLYLPLCVLGAILFFISGSLSARGQETAGPQIQQMIQSGQVTPSQIQQGLQAVESGQVSSSEVRQLSEKAQQGTLTPAEIEAGRKMLTDQQQIGEEQEQSAKEGDRKEPEEEKRAEEGATPDRGTARAERAFFQRMFGDDLNGLDIFGHKLFSRTPELVDPIINVPVSADYIIGTGDVINILMWGRLDANYELEVDSEGMINFPKIGPLNVSGLTYNELKELITRKAEAITGVNASVSMGRLRTMQIFVLGEVKKPGIHTVSSLATAINGLLAAGGPNMPGSLRTMQIKRDGETIAFIDLYEPLLRGVIPKMTKLMPGDIIFVPRAKTFVAITGNVKRPRVFELKESERTLRDALKLAEGLAPRAYNQRIQITRAAENQAEVILDIPYGDLPKHERVPLQDGDIVKVFSIMPEPANAVFLYGNLLRPGKYAYKEGMRLRDIIPDLESLAIDTYFDYGLIKRYHLEDMSTELIPFDLSAMLAGKTSNHNLALQPLDEVHIFNKWKFEDRPTASIAGEVRNPGTYEIQKMRIRDLLFKAGGLSKDAYMETGRLYRTNPQTKDVTIHAFIVAKALAEDPEHNLLLEDMDKVVIHSIWEYVEQHRVFAQGMLNRPGEYPLTVDMTVKDLLLVAGNLRESAFLEQAEIIRSDIVAGKQVQTSLLTFDVRKALAGDPDHNIKLQPWDRIHIKQIPNWGESETITVSGELLFPGTYTIRKGERLSSIIDRAGGFTEHSYFRGAVFTRESVRIEQQKHLDDIIDRLSKEISQVATSQLAGAMNQEDVEEQKVIMSAQQSLIRRLKEVKAEGRVVIKLAPGPEFAQSNYNLALETGDRLYIPPKPDTVSVAGEVYNPTNLVFDQQKPEVKQYLVLTGGPTKYANEKEMYILRADGTVISRSMSGSSNVWLSSFEETPLYPGDTLVVPPKLIHTRFKTELKDITSIIFELAVSAGIIITQVFN